MVEMSETSAILHNAGPRSLVLLDEIGRGTSTYDGVAIAWAVTEHLHDRVGCKTMFATHYHELMQLPERLQHARNYNVAVRETGDTVVFLHRLEPGGTDRSYGIHVAQLAGLPAGVVLERAREILGTLEGEHRVVPGAPPDEPRATRASSRCSLEAPPPDPMLQELRALDVDALTPLRGAQPAGGDASGGRRTGDETRSRLLLFLTAFAAARRTTAPCASRLEPTRVRTHPMRPSKRPSRSTRSRRWSIRGRCEIRESRAASCSGSTPIRRES